MMYKVSLKTLPQRYSSHHHIVWLKDTASLSESVLRIRRTRTGTLCNVSKSILQTVIQGCTEPLSTAGLSGRLAILSNAPQGWSCLIRVRARI